MAKTSKFPGWSFAQHADTVRALHGHCTDVVHGQRPRQQPHIFLVLKRIGQVAKAMLGGCLGVWVGVWVEGKVGGWE